MRRFLPLAIFLILSAGLIFSWFRFGLIYGGGDVGLQTYNPKRILENAKFVWWDSAAPGASIPQGLSAVPFQFFLYILQFLGLPPLLLQATTFFILLFLMGFGMYLFLLSILKDKKGPQVLLAVIGGVFYMFNPYMMIQVWHRFIHTTIFLAASLPFLAIFWSNWIKKGSFKSLLFFLLTNVLSVYLFGTFAFIITVWIFLILITTAEVIPWQGRRKLMVSGIRFLYGFIIWLLINCWWLIPVFKISPVALSEQHKTEESIVTLINISVQAILPYTLQLTNPFYLFFEADFGDIYKNPIFQLIPWFFVSLIFLGLIFSLKKKIYALFGIFFLISIFLAKGASPPFGNLYIQGFINFFPLGVLRNPFEKTGLILAFFATVLFAMGFKILVQKFGNKTRWLDIKVLFSLVLFLILIYSWPMWTGHVLGGLKRNAFVEVPISYRLADQWLTEQKLNGIKDGKLLHLPLTTGEATKYKWKFGYNGLEPSDTFFSAYPSISRGFNIKRLDDSLASLSLIFDKTYFDKELALKYLQDFDVRFIILHKDMDWKTLNLSDPLETEKLLDSMEFLKREEEFGDLIIYKLADKDYQGKASLISDFSLFYPGDEILKEPVFFTDGLMITPFNKIDEALAQKSKEIIIFPKNSFKYGLSSSSAQISQPLLLSNLEEYKVRLGKMGFYLSEKLTEKIIKASKLLLENNIDEYQKVVGQIFQDKIDLSKFAIEGEESALSTLFRFHLSALRELESIHLSDKIVGVKEELTRHLIENNLLPKNLPEDSLQRQFLFFDIPFAGKYKLTNPGKEKLGIPEFMLDGKKFVSNDEQLDLDKGSLEISYPGNPSDNDTVILTGIKQENTPSVEDNIISIIRDSSVLYHGNIKADKPGFLFFRETFHLGWKLSLSNNEETYLVEEHHLANLYGNAWYIDKPGDYSFKIEFEPQEYVNVGILLSILGGILIPAGAYISRKVKI